MVYDAREILFSKLFQLASPRYERILVVSGEAIGPDTWCLEFVRRRCEVAKASGLTSRYRHEQYRCDGIVRRYPSNTSERWNPGSIYPTLRNSKLVRVASAYSQMADVSFLALVDRRSSSGGTWNTIRKARACMQGEVVEV